MKDYILGGVADVHMFDGDELFGNAITTLTDSGMNISISAEEVRGGKGAALLGRFFHSTGMTLTLTNATFNLEYLGLSVGAKLETGAEIMYEEKRPLDSTDGSITLTKTPISLRGACSDDTKVYAWVRKVGSDKYEKKEVSGNTVSGLEKNVSYCAKYFYNEENANTITVASDFVPKTLHLVMDADLYVTGDSACAAQTKAGKITIDVPAFQLNGNQDLTMNMTGAATLNLEGTALAVSDGSGSCDGKKYYAKISQFEESASWIDDIMGIAAEGGTVKAGSEAALYAIYNGKTPLKITAGMLTGYKLTIGEDKDLTGITVPSDTTAGAYTITLFKVIAGETPQTEAIASGAVNVVA